MHQSVLKSSDLKTTGFFVILLYQDGYESDSPEIKFQKIRILTVSIGCCLLLNVCFNEKKQVATFIKWFFGISLGCDLLRKSIDQKNVLSGQEITELNYLVDNL